MAATLQGAPRDEIAAPDKRFRLESETLYRVMGVVASAPDLDRLLEGVVDLLTEATGCHACFIYLNEGRRLRLRAASRIYAQLIGRIELGLDESLAGWVAGHRTPAFIRDNALADPRMKYVPELEEERFQSIVAVPIPARSGESIGVVVLHTVAPHEFDEDVMTFLAHTGSLMAGSIENAWLYDGTRRRVDALTNLSGLAEEIAAAGGHREDLYRAVTGGLRRLMGCEASMLYLLDAGTLRLELAARDPAGTLAPWQEDPAALLELLNHPTRRVRATASRALGADGQGAEVLTAPVAAGDQQLGVIVAVSRRPLRDETHQLLGAVGHLVALALKQVELIERLTGENIVRDLFGALAAGAVAVAEERAHTAGCDLKRPHVFVQLELAPTGADPASWPTVAKRIEQRARRLTPSAICDIGRENLRTLLSLPVGRGRDDAANFHRALDALCLEEHVIAGRSSVRCGAVGGRSGLREATDAVRVARVLRRGGGALSYEELGAYKYLVRLPPDDLLEDVHMVAVQRLVDYDSRRRTQLVPTLERFLLERLRLAPAARALHIHPNTLRQRLGRIEKLSGLNLASEELLSLELAVKLVRLRAAMGDTRDLTRATP